MSWIKIITIEDSESQSMDDEGMSDDDELFDCFHELGCDIYQGELTAWLSSD